MNQEIRGQYTRITGAIDGYKIVEGSDRDIMVFANAINALLKKGWKCQGGVSYNSDAIMQALIKPKK